MDDFGSRCIIGIVVWLVITIIVKGINFFRKRALMAKIPPEAQLSRYVEQIRTMRSQGAGYQDQMNFLIRSGVDKRVAEIVIAQVEKEGK